MVYASIFLLLLFLTLPDSEYPVLPLPDNKPMLVYYDSQWPDPDNPGGSLDNINSPAAALKESGPANNELLLLKKAFFSAASYVNKNPILLDRYASLFADIRSKAKDYDLSDSSLRKTLYLVLEGGRTLIEEIIINTKSKVPPELLGTPVRSSVPSGKLGEINVHSGDLLLSKGPEPQSGIFARIIDFPSGYSHISMVYVDEKTDSVFIIESHPVQGTVIRNGNEYLSYPKKRLMVLRLSSDLPEIKKDPLLPHKAALYALNDALNRNAVYDFKFDYKDSISQFCSEIPYSAYKSQGLLIWEPVPKLLSEGNTKLLAGFGIPSNEILIPAYLEYDPRLVVTAEWLNEKLLYEDHLENVVMDAMMRNEPERYIEYRFYELPYARLVKAYSSMVGLFGAEMIIPPEMTASAALRFHVFRKVFLGVLDLTRKKAEEYYAVTRSLPDIRLLARFAEESLKKYNN